MRTRQRLQQTDATYKMISTADIPTTNILIEGRRIDKHMMLWKQGEWSCNIDVGDHTKSSCDDIGRTGEWCETS